MANGDNLEISVGHENGVASDTTNGFVDYKGNPTKKFKHGGIKAAILVLVTVALENMANFGTSANLVTYFHQHMHYDLSTSANVLTNYKGTTFLLSLVGAFISDAYITRSNTFLIFGSIEVIGFILLAVQAHLKWLQPPPCNVFDRNEHCQHASGREAAVLFSALYLIALGSGGVKGTLPSLGADQFDEDDPKEQRLITSFFNFYLFSYALGLGLGATFLVWIQNNVGWDIAFIISSSSIFVGLLLIITSGYTKFRNRIPTGSPLTKILQVFVAAFWNRKLLLPVTVEANSDKEMQRQFRFLDKAAIFTESGETPIKEESRWRLCTATRVEEVKTLLRMSPIFASAIAMFTCLPQLQTFSVHQGVTMNKKIGNFEIPPASLPIIPMAFIVVLTPTYDRVFVPLARKLTGIQTGITHLQRVGVGLAISTLSMAVAAVVEIKRKHVAEEHHLVDAIPTEKSLPISVFMLAFQYLIFGMADLFAFAGLMNFFYSQAPAGFRSLGTSFTWCSMSMGYYLSTVLVKLVNAATASNTASRGWLKGNNINRNHLELFYFTLATLCLLNFFNYLFWAKWYKYKQWRIEP